MLQVVVLWRMHPWSVQGQKVTIITGIWSKWQILQSLCTVNLCELRRSRIVLYLYGACSYSWYSNQQRHLIKYNKILPEDGILMPKHVGIDTYHELYCVIFILLYCIEIICWLMYWIHRSRFIVLVVFGCNLTAKYCLVLVLYKNSHALDSGL